VNRLDSEPSGGIPGNLETGQSILRELVNQALLLSRALGVLEPTSGGIVPSRMLGDFVAGGLQAMYEATRGETSLEEWLSRALGVDDKQLAQDGPMVLARLLDGASADPRIKFEIPIHYDG
jgi:hypothetical protein